MNAIAVLSLLPQLALLPLSGRVEPVVDGDTVVLAGVGRARRIGVDAPELRHSDQQVRFYARMSADFLTKLAEGRRVTIEYDQRKRDRYGRLLVYLMLPDGRSINAEIIQQGYGFALTKYPFRRLEQHRRLQRQASEARRGL